MPKKNNLLASILVISAIALGNGGSTLYLPAMPIITTALHTTGAMMQLSLSLFLIGFSISQLFYGPLSDAFGRKSSLIGGLIIFIIGSILSALANNIALLLIGRVIEGIGIGAANVVGYALIRDIYSGVKLTMQLSYISVFVGSVPLIAPIIGGYLVVYINWQACFYFLSMIAFILLLLKIFLLEETVTVRDPMACYPAVVCKNYGNLLSSAIYMGYALVAAISVGTVFTVGSTLPFLLVNGFGVSPALYGWIAGIPALGYLSGSFLSGKLAYLFSLPKLILFGSLLGLLSMVVGLIMNIWIVPFSLYTLIIPLVFFMFGMGFLVPTGSSGAMAPFPRLAGSASALLCGFMFFFASILVAIGSHLRIITPAPLFILLSIVCLFDLLFLGFVTYRKPRIHNSGLS